MQLPEQYKSCPRCGFHQALLIMEFDEVLPQLDSLGYPQYHCLNSANVFTALDFPPQMTKQQEADNGNQ